ncbi:MAG: DEAD/DEAH box helicase [Bacteroidales bacterium]|nr:DEAD/DEAH box helicase [Bacteroidales bacterium]
MIRVSSNQATQRVFERVTGAAPGPELSPAEYARFREQRLAVEAVRAAAGTFKAFLLDGVTASGKTEVYLHAVDEALRRGRGALVLVPEISLTHQLVDRLRARFGSADYANAGAMRAVFLNTIREDLTEVARAVRTPTLLIYGTLDAETPPEIGQRLNALIPGSKLVLLERQDHHTVLGPARPQTLFQIQTFLKGLGWLA